MFLIKIINNDYDGMEAFRIAQARYIAKVENKDEVRIEGGPANGVHFNEDKAYGLIVLSTNIHNFDRIVHSNDEIESILGYKR